MKNIWINKQWTEQSTIGISVWRAEWTMRANKKENTIHSLSEEERCVCVCEEESKLNRWIVKCDWACLFKCNFRYKARALMSNKWQTHTVSRKHPNEMYTSQTPQTGSTSWVKMQQLITRTIASFSMLSPTNICACLPNAPSLTLCRSLATTYTLSSVNTIPFAPIVEQKLCTCTNSKQINK